MVVACLLFLAGGLELSDVSSSLLPCANLRPAINGLRGLELEDFGVGFIAARNRKH